MTETPTLPLPPLLPPSVSEADPRQQEYERRTREHWPRCQAFYAAWFEAAKREVSNVR